jgi:sulfur-oxidizing protein SoxY
MNLKPIALILTAAFAFSLSYGARAEAVDKYWGTMQKDYFPSKQIVESESIQLIAPKRAESGAQVPFSFKIDYPMTKDKYIKSVSVIADANPVPLVAVYNFTPESGSAEINTRIRLEVDSYVHVVAETSDGKFLMNKIPIRASGGCGGSVGDDEAAARQSAGKMRLSFAKDDRIQGLVKANLLIKHPMYTGLQRDLDSQGFRPAFFINKVLAKFNGQTIMDADTYIGVSEDPNIQFPFKAGESGKLVVVIKDNEGKEFTSSMDVSLN